MASASASTSAQLSAETFPNNIYDENHQLYQPSPEDNEFISSDESEYEDDGDDDDYEDDGGRDADYSSAPPPIPLHSRPSQLPALKPNLQYRGNAPPITHTRSLPQIPIHQSYPQIKPRNRPLPRRNANSGPLMSTPIYSLQPGQVNRPANIRRNGTNHKVTLSISSNPGDARDPAQPDPEEEGTIMITGAQAATMTFLHFQPGIKREYARNKRIQDRLVSAGLIPPPVNGPARGSLPSNVVPKKLIVKKNPLDSNSLSLSKPSYPGQNYNVEGSDINCGLPAPRRGNQHTPLVDISTNINQDQYRTQVDGYQHPHQGTAEIFEDEDEEDEDEDEEAHDAAEVNSQLLGPPPVITSGRKNGRPPIPSSDDFQPENSGMGDSDEEDISHLLADGAMSSTMISSDFDYDLSLGEQSITASSPLAPLSVKREPVLALPPPTSTDAPHSKLPFMNKYLFPSLGTPIRSRMEDDYLDEAEHRRLILSLESPTSYPVLARSSSTISGAVTSVTGSSFLRSQTLPSFSLTSGLAATPDRGSPRTRIITEGVISTPDVFSHALMDTSITTTISSVSAVDSPVLKRKRTISEDALWMNSIKDAGAWNPPGTFEEDFGIWIDLEKTATPGKKRLGRLPMFGDSSPIVQSAEDDCERAKKKVRISEP
ncbi:hypothetical protein FRC03_006406 [Tulasnella sp. 419]|nr:hypothetical protein FRC03_006406 [Tulasnella sp. 419]